MKKKKKLSQESSQNNKKSSKLFNLSASKINTFESCPAKYYYQYIRKLSQKPSYSKTLGKYAHNVFEEFVRNYLNTKQIQSSLEKAVQSAKGCYYDYPLNTKLMEEGQIWIDSFVEKIKLEGVPKYVSSEIKISFPLNNEFLVKGYIDRVDKVNDEIIKIIDYKSTGYPGFLKPLQLAIYGIAARFGPFKDRKIILSYSLMRSNFEEVKYELTEDLCTQTIEKTIEVGREIKKLVTNKSPLAWKAKPSKLCNYCDYRFQCDKDRQDGWDIRK